MSSPQLPMGRWADVQVELTSSIVICAKRLQQKDRNSLTRQAMLQTVLSATTFEDGYVMFTYILLKALQSTKNARRCQACFTVFVFLGGKSSSTFPIHPRGSSLDSMAEDETVRGDLSGDPLCFASRASWQYLDVSEQFGG